MAHRPRWYPLITPIGHDMLHLLRLPALACIRFEARHGDGLQGPDALPNLSYCRLPEARLRPRPPPGAALELFESWFEDPAVVAVSDAYLHPAPPWRHGGPARDRHGYAEPKLLIADTELHPTLPSTDYPGADWSCCWNLPWQAIPDHHDVARLETAAQCLMYALVGAQEAWRAGSASICLTPEALIGARLCWREACLATLPGEWGKHDRVACCGSPRCPYA